MPGWYLDAISHGRRRAPKRDVTVPRTGQSAGTAATGASARSFSSALSTASESPTAAVCPSSQASC